MRQKHTNKFTEEKLLEIYGKHKHIAKTAAELGVPSITVWRRLMKIGEIKKTSIHSNAKIKLDEILEGKHPYYQTYKLSKRLVKENVKEHICECCGINEWNNKEIILHLDHINGISTDHRLDNLRFLCPNCHSQTDTYCGKNKG